MWISAPNFWLNCVTSDNALPAFSEKSVGHRILLISIALSSVSMDL
jgi:hypothetical protein